MELKFNKFYEAVDAGGSGTGERKFDYEAVQAEIDGIYSDIEKILEIISRKITSTDYISGNAKDSVDAYIGSIPGKFKPIEEQMTKIKQNLDTIKQNYFAAESGINSALGTVTGGTNTTN